MRHTKAGFLTPFLFLLFALPFLTAQTNTDASLIGKTIHHFPPPMDYPDFPFKSVVVDENTPEWAKMVYQPNVNMTKARKLYFDWKAKNPTVKNRHTRNFRKLSGYLANENYVNDEGFIEIPTNEAVQAKSKRILADRAKFSRRKTTSAARNSNNTTWELAGPTFMKTTNSQLVNEHINIYSITQSLSNTDILYCTSESGGTVFKTINNGDSWFSVSDDLITNMAARYIEVAPSNPDIVYLCAQNDIFKSTTGGNNWNSIYNSTGVRNQTFIIHPTNPDIILAGGKKGILKSMDGGTTWTNPLPDKLIYDLRYRPGSTQMIYALVDNATTKQTDFYKSADGGDTWSVRSTGWPMELSTSNTGGQMTTCDTYDHIIYTLIGANWTSSSNSRQTKILKSSDYGESWTVAVDYDEGRINSGNGFYDWDIEMSDLDSNIIAVGTTHSWLTTDGFANRGEDVRVNWSPHEDIQEILFNGTEIWVANDGGIVKFENHLLENPVAKTKGINAISYWSYDLAWNKDVSVATHYHNGTSFTHENYEPMLGVSLRGAEPSFSLVSQPNGNKVLSKGYGAVEGYNIPDQQDGVYSQFSYNLFPNVYAYSGNNAATHLLAHETHFLGKGNALLKSENFGVTWDTIYKFPVSSELVWDIEVTRANTDAIFVGTIGDDALGSLYRSLDGGKSFTKINLPNNFSSNPRIINVSVSNEDENTFYVMGNRTGTRIAKTTDGGNTWVDLATPTLDGYGGRKIMQVDGTDGGIYLLTNTAIFYRNNTLTDWVALTDGLPANADFQYIRPFYRDNSLRIATSRGVYKAALYDTPQLSDVLLQPTTSKTKADCARDTLYFEDYSVVEHAGATWSWSFPGAAYVSATNVRNPKVVFGNIGQFDVTMSITKGGQTFTKTVNKMITIDSQCGGADNFAGKALLVTRVTDDHAETGDFNLTTNTFTFTAWVKPTVFNLGYSGIFSNGAQCHFCNAETLGLIINGGGDRLYYRWPGSTSSWTGASDLYLKREEWSYVAFVMSPDKVTIYMNDEKWESNISHAPTTIRKLYLGYGLDDKHFNGQIDEATFWNRSLTAQEIKELMHLTKDPTTAPGLISYFQFNEGSGVVIDKAGDKTAYLSGDAKRVLSSAPVGGGTSQTQTESAGNVAFTDADLTINFINQSGIEVVASKINNAPYNFNGFIAGDVPIAEEYWAIHRFGEGNFTANLTFKTSVDINTSDAANACQYALYKRGNRSDADWEYLTSATSADAATDKITFTANVSEWAQYLILKSTTPIIRGNSPVVLKNTFPNTTSIESSYTIAAANLSGNLQITAPSGFEISTTSGAGFTNNLSLSPIAGKISNVPIYVRFTPTEKRSYIESIIHSSTGATNLLVEVQSNGIGLDQFPGTALSLDGSSDYVNLGNPTDLQITGDLTIQMWVKPANFSARRNPIGKAYGGEFTISQNTDGTLAFYNGSSGGNSASFQSTDANHTLILNEWQHLTLVRDIGNQTVKWYINGVQTNERTGARTDIVAGNNEVFIGDGYLSGYAGLIDEVRIWNVPLSEQQIQEQMHLTLDSKENGLVAYYQFNETNKTAKDLISGLDGAYINQATRSTATEPVGGGFSNTQTSPSGTISFTNTDIQAIFNNATTDKVVATKLALAPNDEAGIGTGESVADQQYWVVNRYGGANDMNANLTFTLGEDIAASESVGSLKLYGRNQTSDGNWTLITAATSIDATANTATFNNVTTYQQYLITKGPFPKITVNLTTIAFGNFTKNLSTYRRLIEVSGTNLTGAINITAPSGFEISTMSSSGFTNNLVLTPSGGTVAEMTIYARFSPTTTGYQSGDILFTTTGGASRAIRVDGTGVIPEIELRLNDVVLNSNTTTIDFGNHKVGEDTLVYFSIRNTGLGQLSLERNPTIVVIGGANATDFVSYGMPQLNYPAGATSSFDITFSPSGIGPRSATVIITNNDEDENPYIINLTGTGKAPPSISVSSLSDFDNELVGNTSAEKTYTVSGADLTDAITLSSTAGFELSLTSGTGFGSSLTLQPTNGTVASTTIYVRFVPLGVATYTGTINHTSTNAPTQTVTFTASSSKFAEGLPGNALDFDGINDYVEIDASGISLSNAFTVEFWTNQEGGTGARNSPFYAIASNNARVINLHMPWVGRMYFDAGANGSYDRIDKAVTAADFDGWHHWAFVKDATTGTMKIYRDGVLWHEGTAKTKTIGEFNRIFLGKNESTAYYDGQLEEVRLWNTARTETQIRENIHLTQLTDEVNLLLYHQFNETNYNTIFNVKGNAHGSLVNGTQRIVSTRPVGGGFSDTKTESMNTISFTDTDVEVQFTSQTGAKVVVAKINLAPNVSPTGLSRIFDSQYWAINRYGTGAFAGNITFKVAEDLTTADEQSPDEILLYGRNFNSDMAWALVDAATAVDAANDKATFDNISNFDQFLIVSSSNGIAAPADCIPDMVYENRNDLPNLNSSTTYIKAGNINGSGGVVIESGQNILFRAKDYIQLMPGFTVKAGAEFTAKIADCSAGAITDVPEEKAATARTAPIVTEPEIKTALEMNVYPNPFETRFFIDYRINKTAQVTIQLYDLAGKKVRDILLDKHRKAGTYQARFTNRNLTVGTYILRIEVGNEVAQRKVVMSGQK